jgi:predicted DNA binding CopG/RHH family protein
MATTINLKGLSEDLMRKCKTLAASQGITFREFVIRALKKASKAK